MSLDGHLKALKKKHETLDGQIQTELQRPSPNSIAIQDMKRQKLRIKEELSTAA